MSWVLGSAAISEGQHRRQKKSMNQGTEVGSCLVGSVQGKHPAANLAGKYGHEGEDCKVLARGVGRGQITMGHEYQSQEFVLYLVGSRGAIEGF